MTALLECLGGIPGAIVGMPQPAMANQSVLQRMARAFASPEAVDHASVMQLAADLEEGVMQR